MILIAEDKKQFKANLHCHSNMSDGKLSPADLKRIYKDKGYSVLAITDHEYPFDHSEMSEEDFLMITGYEAYIRPSPDCTYDYYGSEIHINLFAKEPHNTSYVNYVPVCCKYIKDAEYLNSLKKVGSGEVRRYTPEYINSFVEEAKRAGYLASHNHPVWSLENESDIMRYEGFFSMEMCNYGCYIGGVPEYNSALYNKLLRAGKRIFCHSADDNHNHQPLDSASSDSFGGFTMILAEELEYSSVIKALETGNFYSSMGPVISSLEIENGKAKIKTSPATQISMHYGAKAPRRVTAHTDSLCEAEFEIPKEAAFVRFSVMDSARRFADTRGFFRDEFEG